MEKKSTQKAKSKAKSMAKKPTTKLKGIVPSEVHGYAPRLLSQTINKLTKSMLGRQGLIRGDIISKWFDIVGPEISQHTLPEKIVFSKDGASGGELRLRCDSGALANQLQHQAPQIIDRINMYFGYQAIIRIKLIQAPLPRRPTVRRTSSKPLTKEQVATIKSTTSIVQDDEIRAVLDKLGQSVMSRDQSKFNNKP